MVSDAQQSSTEFKRAHEKRLSQPILETKSKPENKAKVTVSDPALNLGKAKAEIWYF